MHQNNHVNICKINKYVHTDMMMHLNCVDAAMLNLIHEYVSCLHSTCFAFTSSANGTALPTKCPFCSTDLIEAHWFLHSEIKLPKWPTDTSIAHLTCGNMLVLKKVSDFRSFWILDFQILYIVFLYSLLLLSLTHSGAFL